MDTYKCTTCAKGFSSDVTLYQHKLKTLHKCETCQHHFICRNGVKKHMRTHKLHICTIPACNRGFFLRSALQQHMSNSSHTKKKSTRTRTRKTGKATPNFSLTTKPLFLKELAQCGTLERLLKERVEPDSETVANCKKVVDDIVNFLHHRAGFDVAEVFKGGSQAKRTGIKLMTDIDLVVFLNETTMVELESEMDRNLTRMKELLITNFEGKVTFESGREFTRHSVQFKLACSRNDIPHDVDLLPAVDLIAKYGTKEEVYKKMKKDAKSRPFYSACLTKLQVDFVEDKCKTAPDLRGLIRLVKHWKVTEDLLQLKSYSVELIVIKLWQDWGRPKSFDLTEKFRKVMGALSNLGSMKITWPEEYDISLYRKLPGDKVIIMDPANPYGNTAEMLKKNQTIARIEKKAKDTFEPL